MADVAVPTAPALVTVPGVELMHAGSWQLSSGPAEFTTADFYAAVAALECPAVHNPGLKLGHEEPDPDPATGNRWDGEPSIGWVGNLGVVEGGRTLVGDYIGMPNWLGSILPSAYPNRSIEGWYDYRCQLGHTHPFVLTAVALLGVMPPGIGTIQSLQDVAALYGVTAASNPASAAGTPFLVHATQEVRVPNPTAQKIAAAVTSEDVKRAFYGSDYGKGWDIWITEIQLGPEVQLIVCDDANGTMSRVPVTIGEGDGEEAVTFADPVKVVIRYEDASSAVAASAGQPAPIRYASRAESRPSPRPAATHDPEPVASEPLPEPDPDVEPDPEPEPQDPADPADPSPTTTEGAGMDPAKLREALGLQPEASDEEVGAAIAASGLAPQPEPTVEVEPVAPVAPVLPEGVTTIDEAALADLLEKAEQGVAARAQQRTEARDRLLDDAVRAGKFPPVRREHWQRSYDLDPEGTQQALASLAPGLVPLADAGSAGPAEEAAESFADVDRLFSRPVPTRQGA